MGVPKPTEMTIRSFLLKELEKRGVKVNTEISYATPIGRLMPDMLLYNGAQYVVETKLGAEAKLLDAMVRLYDYSKYTQTKGAFAVLFPKELRQPWAIEILEKIPEPKIPPSIGFWDGLSIFFNAHRNVKDGLVGSLIFIGCGVFCYILISGFEIQKEYAVGASVAGFIGLLAIYFRR